MHANGLLSLKNPCLMSHHTWLVQSGLTIQDEDVAVVKVPENLFPDNWSLGSQCSHALLYLARSEQLICYSSALL